MCTSNLPPPIRNLNINYADDIIQITGFHRKSKNIIRNITERKVEIINTFEKMLENETKIYKFTPVALGSRINTSFRMNTITYHSKEVEKL